MHTMGLPRKDLPLKAGGMPALHAADLRALLDSGRLVRPLSASMI